jgi:hypothetical protein
MDASQISIDDVPQVKKGQQSLALLIWRAGLVTIQISVPASKQRQENRWKFSD